MPFEVECLDNNLYRAREYADNWTETWVSDQIARDEMYRLLVARGHHPRDVIEWLEVAGKAKQDGRRDSGNEVKRIWRKSVRGEACSQEDLDFIRSELAKSPPDSRRTYYIQILHRTGQNREAESAFVEIAETSPARDDVELALRFLFEWYPTTFALIAPAFIRGQNAWSENRGTRAWAMVYATGLLLKKQFESLFEDVLHVANDDKENWLIRLDAARQVARLAEGPSDDPRIYFREDESNLVEDSARARQYLRGEQPKQ
jgi:hypothetical protein